MGTKIKGFFLVFKIIRRERRYQKWIPIKAGLVPCLLTPFFLFPKAENEERGVVK